MYRKLYIIAVAAFCLSAVPCSAEMYHWVDKQGIQHFSDVPPESGVVGDVQQSPEIPYDAKADEARNAKDKAAMDKIMSEESQETSPAAGQTDEEASATPPGGSDQDVEPDVVYEGGDAGGRNDVLGINERAESAPERKKELQQAKERHEAGETRPHTEHSDDVLGVNEAAESEGARGPVEPHPVGHGGKR